MNMSRAFRCEKCDGESMWRIERVGDAAVSWACPEDLSSVCEGLQRDWEVTILHVHLQAKGTEWTQLSHSLNQIANGQR